jgi:hypothetical protein
LIPELNLKTLSGVGLVTSKMALYTGNLETSFIGGLETQLLEGNNGDEFSGNSKIAGSQSDHGGLDKMIIQKC